ncbi:MAG: hypothetical protein NTW33_02430, partial [Methanoregula sp.]|nr:hypothetical protein [Methanoregula sp.]
QSAAMEQVYMDYVEGNYARYALHAEYASAFFDMMTRHIGAPVLKCQVTGPVTFGMQVVDAEKRPIYYDAQLADVLSKMIALKARWCEVAMREKAGWNDIASLVEGGLGIHCCSNTDWEFLISLNPAVLSIDAYMTAKEFLLYADSVARYMERGGVVAWGIVPAEYKVFATETVDSLYERYLAIRKQLSQRVTEQIFDAQSLITPSCGIRFADRNGSLAIMRAAAEISRRIRDKSS